MEDADGVRGNDVKGKKKTKTKRERERKRWMWRWGSVIYIIWKKADFNNVIYYRAQEVVLLKIKIVDTEKDSGIISFIGKT